MAKEVRVLSGFVGVALPTGPDGEDQGYHSGEKAVLTNDQYRRLSPATRRGITVGKDVPDPEPAG